MKSMVVRSIFTFRFYWPVPFQCVRFYFYFKFKLDCWNEIFRLDLSVIVMFYQREKTNLGLQILCKLNEKFTTNPKQKSLTIIYLALNLFLRFYLAFQIIFLTSIAYFVTKDLIKGYGQNISFILLFRFCILTVTLIVTVFFVTSLGIFWLQMYIVVSVFNRRKLLRLRKKINKLVSKYQGKLICSIYNNQTLFYLTGTTQYYPLSHQLLQDLCKINNKVIRYSDEYQTFIGCFYYTMIFACDALFFLMIDWRTQQILKSLSTSIFTFIASITTVAFIIFDNLDSFGKQENSTLFQM